MKITNKWQIATIILGIILIGLIVVDYYRQERFGDIQISKDDLEGFTQMALDNKINKFKLCDIKTAECIIVKIGEPNSVSGGRSDSGGID